MLTAIGVILSLFKIPINEFIEIRFTTIPISIAGYMLGPVVSAIVGILVDILGFIVRPTGPYFFGYTLSNAIGGLIFGLILYKKKITLLRVFIAEALYTLIVCIILNSLWASMLYYSDGYIAVILMRLPKELIMLPIMTVILYSVMRSLKFVISAVFYERS